MHIRSAKLICDKCSKEIDIDPGLENPFCSSFVVSESPYRDWGEVKGKHFCGDCYQAYKDMVSAKEAEIAARFNL